MPRVQGMDAAKRRRPGGIFSLSTPFRATHGNGRSASASTASGREVDDMDDTEFSICQREERAVSRTSPVAQVYSEHMKEANSDNGQNVADVSERDGCGGPASASSAQRHSRRAVENREEEGESRQHLKSPPELTAGDRVDPRSAAAAGRALKSTSPLKSRWAPPDAGPKKIHPPPHLSRLQSNLANRDSLIDTLKTQTRPAPSPNEVLSSQDDLQKHKSNTCTSSKGGVAISNLEESYFPKKPAPNSSRDRSGPNKSGNPKPPRRTDLSNKEGNKTRGFEPEPPTSKGDECSGATWHSTRQLKQSATKQADDENDCPTTRNITGSQSQGSSKIIGGTHEDEASTGANADVERAKSESNKLAEERRISDDAKYQADLDRAIAASKRQQQPRYKGMPSAASEVIELLDSDDEDDSKMPAIITRDIQPERQPSARVTSMAASSNQMDENAQMEEAIKLSMAEAEKVKKRKEYQQYDSIPQTCRQLNRDEFKRAVDEFVLKQGGYEKIEAGQLVKHGNEYGMKKSCIAEGGGQNQTGATYGRYSIERMWRLFDVLEGKADVNLEESGVAVKRNCESSLKRGREKKSRLDGLSGAKIKAFLDIGHGLGIQVLQAGWSLGVPSRGVEIMNNRHLIAKEIKKGVIDSLRPDYPDSTMARLENEDFSRAVVPDKATNKRDEELRKFLLFQDNDNQGNRWSNEVQKGLVIFINNAEEVFAARSNQRKDGACLDVYLANLFANMQVGGRMVTLTDVSCHLTQSSEWFQLDVFKSGSNAVSWGNSSVSVYVLTKLSDKWYCQNKKCEYRRVEGGPAQNNVVLENGELCEKCVFCDMSAKRSTRLRKPSAKRRRKN